jgi:hypothetical protein
MKQSYKNITIKGKIILIAVALFFFCLLMPTVSAGAQAGTVDQTNFTVFTDSSGTPGTFIGAQNPVTLTPGQEIWVAVQLEWTVLQKQFYSGIDWRVWGGNWYDTLDPGASSATAWEFIAGTDHTDDSPRATTMPGSTIGTYWVQQKKTQDPQFGVTTGEYWYPLEAPTKPGVYELQYVRSASVDGASIGVDTYTVRIKIYVLPTSGMAILELDAPTVFKTVKGVINATIVNVDGGAHNQVNVSLNITGVGNPSTWAVQPGWSQMVDFPGSTTTYVIFNITPTSNANVGIYVANVSENFSSTSLTDSFTVHPKATGTPNETLAFFMTSGDLMGADGPSEGGGAFDACPIVLNDYGDTTAKCELWDCTDWSVGGENYAMVCTGSWSCTEWNNNVTCMKYECDTWAAGGVQKAPEYCKGGYNCTSWHDSVCDDWDCLGWQAGPLAKSQVWCSGEWHCGEWIGSICGNWNCTEWTTPLDEDKTEQYCAGGWNCTDFAITGMCDDWNCSLWTNATTTFAKYDVYCAGLWNCSIWENGICENWDCTYWDLTNVGGIEDEYDTHCTGGWNCTTWTDDDVCRSWNCTSWTLGSTKKSDYYCSGGFECLQYEEFAPSDDLINPDINITYPINNTAYTNTGLDILFTRSDNQGLHSCWYSNDTYLANSSSDVTCGNVTSIVWSLGNHNVTVWANDTTGNLNWSSVTFNITVATDSCDPPENGDWTIDCSHDCVWDNPLTVPDNITMIGTGKLMLNTKMGFTSNFWQIYLGNGCELAVNSGGSIENV